MRNNKTTWNNRSFRFSRQSSPWPSGMEMSGDGVWKFTPPPRRSKRLFALFVSDSWLQLSNTIRASSSFCVLCPLASRLQAVYNRLTIRMYTHLIISEFIYAYMYNILPIVESKKWVEVDWSVFFFVYIKPNKKYARLHARAVPSPEFAPCLVLSLCLRSTENMYVHMSNYQCVYIRIYV